MKRGWMVGVAAAVMAVAGCTQTKPADGVGGGLAGTRSMTLERAMLTLQLMSRDRDPVTRANCIEALQVSEDRRAMEAIEQGLHDDAAGVRFVATLAAGKRKAVKLKPVLEGIAKLDPSDSARVGAVYALYKLGETSQMNLLIQGLNSRDAATRSNTCMVLGLMGDKAVIPLLRSKIREQDPRAKFELTAALARLGDEEAQNVIASLVLSKTAEDQWNALAVAGDLPEEKVVNSLLVALREPLKIKNGTREQEVRRQLLAARALGKFGKITGGKLALEYAKDKSAELRMLAALALGELLRPDEEYALKPLLDDKDAHVRLAAAAAIVNVWSKLDQAPVK